MPFTVFHISLYGRFGYFVMAIFGAAFSLLMALALRQYQILPFWALLFLGLLFIALAAIGVYSISQLFRFTPRFVLTEQGFAYRGLISSFERRWSDVVSFRLRYAGDAPFIFLEVVFSNSPSRFRKRISLDVSGLNPDHQQLVSVFNRYARSSAGRPSPW